MKQTLSFIALVAAAPAFAEDARQLDAHEHGVGALNVAIEGPIVAMEFHAPGADIVGFEYAAKSDVDLAAIDAAVATLSAPLELFVLPSAAVCKVTMAKVELEREEDHGDHDSDDHDDHDHDDHDEDDDAAQDGQAGHTEFHAEYTLTCDTPQALNKITFAYFEAFPNAKEVEVQIVSANGAQAFEVERETPVLDLGR